MPITTTLNFSGRTEEALAFYGEVLNVEILFLMQCSEAPTVTGWSPGMEDLLFHATFRIEGTLFMASDLGASRAAPPLPFSGFALAIALNSVERAKRIVDHLTAGGKVLVPFTQSAFTSWYGVVVDKFGMTWKLNVESEVESPVAPQREPNLSFPLS